MATLDDKILGERAGDNYCSSSEDEGESQNEGNGGGKAQQQSAELAAGRTFNTGPKGVIEDWRRYKQLQSEQHGEEQAELVKMANKLSMTCRTYKDDERAKQIECAKKLAEEDAREEDLGSDDAFVKMYMQKRLAEMKAAVGEQMTDTFGKLFTLRTADDYLHATDSTDQPNTTVIVHIYETGVSGCDEMTESLEQLALTYRSHKFCRVLASVLGTSQKFKKLGVPTLQAYKGGELIANLVRGDIDAQIGDSYKPDDVAGLLCEYGVLPAMHEK